MKFGRNDTRADGMRTKPAGSVLLDLVLIGALLFAVAANICFWAEATSR
jgi:hypothetical protein